MNADYENLKIDGIVELHQARAQEKGAPDTLSDHLNLDGENDLPRFKKHERAIFNQLREGGRFHDLLGSVYLLSENAGRQPKGFGDNPPRGRNKREFNPGKAVVALRMNEIAERHDMHFGSSSPAITMMGRTTATLPVRQKQQQILAGVMAFDQELAFSRAESEHDKETIDMLRRENELLREQRGIPLLDAPRRGRSPTVASNGNGGNGTH